MKKKILVTLLVSTLTISLVACGEEVAEKTDVSATEQTAVIETELPETEATELLEEATEEPTEATEAVEPEPETELAAEAPAYTVTDMSATKYAKSSVNVRKGPASDYEKLGGLNTNQQVMVTGRADTGWYRIDYNGEEGFVSDKYLVDTKVMASTNTSTPSNTNATTPADTTNANSNDSATTATDNSGNTWTGDNSGNTSISTPDTNASVDTSTGASTPDTSTSANTGSTNTGTVIDGSNMSIDDLNALTGGGQSSSNGVSQGNSSDIGVGGDWIH